MGLSFRDIRRSLDLFGWVIRDEAMDSMIRLAADHTLHYWRKGMTFSISYKTQCVTCTVIGSLVSNR